MRLAWHMAALQRQERLPELKTLCIVRPRRQTPDEQRLVLETLSARFGIPLQRVRLIPRDVAHG